MHQDVLFQKFQLLLGVKMLHIFLCFRCQLLTILRPYLTRRSGAKRSWNPPLADDLGLKFLPCENVNLPIPSLDNMRSLLPTVFSGSPYTLMWLTYIAPEFSRATLWGSSLQIAWICHSKMVEMNAFIPFPYVSIGYTPMRAVIHYCISRMLKHSTKPIICG